MVKAGFCVLKVTEPITFKNWDSISYIKLLATMLTLIV